MQGVPARLVDVELGQVGLVGPGKGQGGAGLLPPEALELLLRAAGDGQEEEQEEGSGLFHGQKI